VITVPKFGMPSSKTHRYRLFRHQKKQADDRECVLTCLLKKLVFQAYAADQLLQRCACLVKSAALKLCRLRLGQQFLKLLLFSSSLHNRGTAVDAYVAALRSCCSAVHAPLLNLQTHFQIASHTNTALCQQPIRTADQQALA